MTGWSPGELGELNRAESLHLTAGPQPGPETELGMVTVDGQLYVRAYRGPSSRWFRAARDAGTSTITAGILARAVRLIPDPGPGRHYRRRLPGQVREQQHPRRQPAGAGRDLPAACGGQPCRSTLIQNFAPSPPEPAHSPRTSFSPARVTPIAA